MHELKHDGYRLQIHVRDGRMRLYTMNGADWSKRYPRIIEEAARIKGHAIIDAEVVCLDSKGVAQFDLLHNRSNDGAALALAFDLLALNGEDLRKRPLVERKAALSKLLIRSKGGIQYVEHADGHGERMFEAVFAKRLVQKPRRATSPACLGHAKTWTSGDGGTWKLHPIPIRPRWNGLKGWRRLALKSKRVRWQQTPLHGSMTKSHAMNNGNKASTKAAYGRFRRPIQCPKTNGPDAAGSPIQHP